MNRRFAIYLVTILIIMLYSVPLNAFADGTRGVATYVEGIDPNLSVGRQYLVLIAIDAYQQWLPLHSPVKDVREIRGILTDRYYIDEVFELYNAEATKANIIKLFVQLQNTVQVDDSVLILYSGHGHLDENSNIGFWIPVNAGTDIYEQQNWLPHTQLKGLIANIKARHVCVISDSCFAGDLIYNTRSIPPAIDAEYFKRSYSRVSRQVITSGATEAVPDHSEFAEQMKSILRRNQSRFLDSLMLYNEVRLGVESSIPLLGAMGGTGHQEGASFVLFLRDAAPNEPTPFGPIHPDPAPSTAVVGGRSRNFLSTGITAGWIYPVAGMASLMNIGLNIRTQLHVNYTKDRGTFGFGFSTGLVSVVAENGADPPYDMRSIPVAMNMIYRAPSASKFFWSADLSCGAMINFITLFSGFEEHLTTVKPYLSPTLSLGRRFFERWEASAYGSYLLILFDNNAFTGIATGIRIRYMFEGPRQR